jgi:membrane protein DedA with SNARE-associated domain
MSQRAEAILEWFDGVPEWLVYLLMGLAAALENLIPPIPADVFIVIGGVMAGAGAANPWSLFLVVWLCNASSALLVYFFGLRFGAGFFQGRLGQFLLAPRQLVLLNQAYRRFGFPIIFFSRFLPVFRPIVPAFAGIAGVGLLRTAIPIALASAIWYGFLVYLGTVAGANLPHLFALLDRVSGWMWLAATFLIALLGWWWWRTRHGEIGSTQENSI